MKVLNHNSLLPYIILLILCILIYFSIPSHNAAPYAIDHDFQRHDDGDFSKSLVHERWPESKIVSEIQKGKVKGSVEASIHKHSKAKNSSVPKFSRIDPIPIKDDSGKTWVDRVYMINRRARFDRLQVCLTMLNRVAIYPQVFDAIEPPHDPVKGIVRPLTQAAIILTRVY